MKKSNKTLLTSLLLSSLLLTGCNGGSSTSSTSYIDPIEPSLSDDSEIKEAEEQAKVVIDMINALTDESSEADVLAVVAAYSNLSLLAKGYISEEALTKLNRQTERIKEEKKALKVEEVINAIDALSDDSSRTEVYAVKDLYEALDEELRIRVTNYDKLHAQVERVKMIPANEMTAVINSLIDPSEVIGLSNDEITEKYFELFEIKEQYNALTEEDLNYMSNEVKDKYVKYIEEFNKSIFVVIDGAMYEKPNVWEPIEQTTNELYPTWSSSYFISGEKQQIYVTQNLYVEDVKGIALMIKPTVDSYVHYYSNMTASYESEGHIINYKSLEANKWNVVSTNTPTPVITDTSNLSRFDFFGSNWTVDDSIELTYMIGIRNRKEDTDKYEARKVEAMIDALNESSTQEDVEPVMLAYNALSEQAKALVSEERTNKLNELIKEHFLTLFDFLLENAHETLRKESYYQDYYAIESVLLEYEYLPESVRDLITNKEKLNTIKSLYESINVYHSSNEIYLDRWDYGASSVGLIREINGYNSVEFTNNTEVSLKVNKTSVDYSSSEKIIVSIYNPTNNNVDVHIHGGYGDGWGVGGTHQLKAHSWNDVVLSSEVFKKGNGESDNGIFYMVFNGGDVTGEWLFSSIIDYKVTSTVENYVPYDLENHNMSYGMGDVWNLANKTTDEEKGNVFQFNFNGTDCITTNSGSMKIDEEIYEGVEFYVYNGTGKDFSMYSTTDWIVSTQYGTLTNGTWTRCFIPAAEWNKSVTTYFYPQNAQAGTILISYFMTVIK